VSADHQSYTVLGASGFIGAAMVASLESRNQVVHAVTRASLPALLASRRPAGHVIDCAGLTAEFSPRPFDAAEVHVGLVARCLSDLKFDSFLLLSCTGVYCRANTTHEDTALLARPSDPSDLHHVTKLAGEALCLADPRPEIRVARLSSVYGIGMPPGSPLGRLINDGVDTGGVLFRRSAASVQDYVNLAAVVRLLPAMTTTGRHRIYNLASGRNISHATLADRLRAITGWRTSFATDAPASSQRPIDTTRLNDEFGPTSSDLLADLPALLAFAQERRCSQSTNRLAA
jgi:nucleoside-diphosphate-sugar epimerase